MENHNQNQNKSICFICLNFHVDINDVCEVLEQVLSTQNKHIKGCKSNYGGVIKTPAHARANDRKLKQM